MRRPQSAPHLARSETPDASVPVCSAVAATSPGTSLAASPSEASGSGSAAAANAIMEQHHQHHSQQAVSANLPAPLPLPPAEVALSELSPQTQAMAAVLGLPVAAGLVAAKWFLRRRAVEHVLRVVEQWQQPQPAADCQRPQAASEVDALCHVVELTAADSVIHVLKSGLLVFAALPITAAARSPRLVSVLEHIVFRCHDHNARVRCVGKGVGLKAFV